MRAALTASALTALAAAGCAQLPDSIPESYVDDAYYRSLDCQQLRQALGHVRREEQLAARQQSAYAQVLIPPREATRNTERIAALKGTSAAIARAQSANGCLQPSDPSGADEAVLPADVEDPVEIDDPFDADDDDELEAEEEVEF